VPPKEKKKRILLHKKAFLCNPSFQLFLRNDTLSDFCLCCSFSTFLNSHPNQQLHQCSCLHTSTWVTSQDILWVPEAIGHTKPWVYYVFPTHTYDKVNLSARHSKRLTIANNQPGV
jgi:hypothetical protein